MSRPYPIVEYARKIGKNTADFTAADLGRFMREWLKQPQRKDLLVMTPEQRKVYENDVKKAQKYFQKYPEKARAVSEQINKSKGANMPVIKANAKMKHVPTPADVEEMDETTAQQAEEEMEEVVFEDMDEDGEEVVSEEETTEEEVTEQTEEEEEAVANIGLTRQDVDALVWGITQLFEDYDLSEHEMGPTLASLKEVLEGV